MMQRSERSYSIFLPVIEKLSDFYIKPHYS